MGIRGICPIAPAVFDERGALDLEDYRRCCERMIEHGAEGLTLFGIDTSRNSCKRPIHVELQQSPLLALWA